MRFRPCIDIHNGQVKQIVGSSLKDTENFAIENFVSEMTAKEYAKLYCENGLFGGHIILLNSRDSKYYEEDVKQAEEALKEYTGGLQIGGGIDDTNAAEWIKKGASHVIVTSYVFYDGKISFERLDKLVQEVGKKHIVLDLSCRKKEDSYYIVTNRWQEFTKEKLTVEILNKLSDYCDEFLIHAVDVEGKATGIELGVIKVLNKFNKIPITYAGGISSIYDIELLFDYSKGRIDFTVGSALDLFGGPIKFQEIITRFVS